MKTIYDEAIEIIESRTKIGTMSRDYGHTVDDVLHVENAYELTKLDKALERAKKVEELLGLYREKCQLLLDDVYVARPYIEIDNRIIKLEKELEELK